MPDTPRPDPDAARRISDALRSTDTTPFSRTYDFEAEGMAHPVFQAGEGPGVLLMHEMPGFVPQFWRLAHWLVRAGFQVHCPAYFEKPGADPVAAAKPKSLPDAMRRACISREIHLFARGGRDGVSPLTAWLSALARQIHDQQGGPGIGVIGLCLTGNFAWTLAVEPSVLAPVAAEPSLPLSFRRSRDGLLHMDEAGKAALAARADQPVMALRFDGDPVCRAARFDALRALIGPDRLIERVMPNEAQNPNGNRFPHAVLTRDLIQEDGQPTFEAAREVLEFMTERLSQPAG